LDQTEAGSPRGIAGTSTHPKHRIIKSNRRGNGQGESVAPPADWRAIPRDRPEEELAGYRTALDWIFSRRTAIEITPEVIRRLHPLAQAGSSGDAGEWKKRDNEVIEILPTGERSIRFVPVSAQETPAYVQMLCHRYRTAVDEERLPPLLIVATFVFDLLCIHPFRDGNGRVSRLATSLLLQNHGFQVSRYVSLERLVEERKEEYYEILKLCSRGWREGSNEIIPWWNYFLAIVRRAYIDFENQVELVKARPAKSDLVRKAVLDQVEPFTLADMAAQLPSASPQLIKKVLAEMKAAGQLRLAGRGRGARWEVAR
jgi:Fic family protein